MAVPAEVRRLERARDAYFREGAEPDASVIRPSILESWRRSARHGLTPTSVKPVVLQAEIGDSQLRKAARPVVEARLDGLAGMACGLTLTDAEGCLLDRWSTDPHFVRRLDARFVLPGFGVAESQVGTTSSGIALETGDAVLVAGAEHFCEDALTLSSAGAAVRHPVNRRIVGSLNLNCDLAQTTPLMLAWVKDVAALIEKRLLEALSDVERLLLDTYLTATRSGRPLLCLNGNTIIGNTAAARLMSGVDQGLLWEGASRAIRTGRDSVISVPTTGDDDRPMSVMCSPITDGDTPVGALLRLRAPARGSTLSRTPAAGPTAAQRLLPKLAGRSAAWLHFCSELAAALGSGREVLLLGEAGTGKSAVLAQLVVQAEATVLDARDPVARASWHDRLAGALRAEADVVLENLQVLPAELWAASMRLIREAEGRPYRVLAAVRDDGTAGPETCLLEAEAPWPGQVVRLPSLRDRSGDLSLLLEVLTAERTTPQSRPAWAPDAVQVLGRVSWAANISSLSRLVDTMLHKRLGPLIRRQDLPADLQAAATRRDLVGLERLEAQAIAAALRAADGNKQQAAASLGIARSTLYRKLRALGLDLTNSAW